MKLFTALLGVAPLLLAGLMSTAEVDVDEYDEDDGDGHQHVFLITARTGPEDVLVVRSTRWENGVKVFAVDEIRCQPPGRAVCRIALAERERNSWHLSEAPVEQHLRGLKLVRWERTCSGALIELQPAGDGVGPRCRHLFQWEARLEKWCELDRLHPDLPAHPAGAEWVRRKFVFPRTASLG